MKHTNFTTRARSFIEHCLNQRNYLIKARLNRKNEISVSIAAGFLSVHLENNRYDDYRMALFVLRHKDKILDILPGFGSPIQTAMEREAYGLFSEAKLIVERVWNPELFASA